MDLKVEKLNPKTLVARASALGLKVEKDDPVEKLAREVSEALCNLYEEEALSCGVCGLKTPDTTKIPSCPGCGVWFEEKKDDKRAEESTVKAESAKAEHKNGASNGAHGKAIAASPAKRLKEINSEIQELKKDIASAGWDIGNHLAEVLDRDLWKAGEFKNFDEYVEREFKFTPQNAREMVRVARAIPRTQIGDLHFTHLRLISKIPDAEEREKLLEEAKKSKPSKRELAEKVKEKREEAGLSTERKGMKKREAETKTENTVLVSARLEPGEVASGRWSKYERGIGRGKFKIGESTFLLETNGKEGFTVSLVRPKKDA